MLNQLKGNSLKATLMRGGIISIAIKVFGLGFSLLTAIILARTLGPEQYGVYSYVLAIVSILAIPAMFGLPTLIVRETAKAEVKEEWGKIRGLWFWSNSVTASLSLIIALITATLLWLNRDSFTQIQFLTFAWGIVFIPLSALAALRGASLRGLRKVIQGQLPEQIIKPALFIIMLVIVSVTGIKQLTAESAMMLNALSAGVAFVFGAWVLYRVKPKQLVSVEKEYERKAWTSSVVPFAVLSGLAVIVTQTDIVMLGLMRTSAEVGIYKVASQGADLAAFGIVAANMVAMPYMSRLANSNDIKSLEKIVQNSARLSLFFSIIITALFAIIGDKLINFVFGSDYVVAYFPLLLLALGQVFHAGLGQGGTLLNMCGHEKGTLITLILSALLNVVLNFIFIPLWGIHGAATATLISVLFRKIVIWTMVYIIYGIDSSALALQLRSKLAS